MPLFFRHTLPEGSDIACWDAQEADDFFLSQLMLRPELVAELDSVHPQRRSEWLASRHLMHLLLPEEAPHYRKDSWGKPYLPQSPIEISLSHSRDKVAFCLSLLRCGIDIQYLSETVRRIRNKFLWDEELVAIDGLSDRDSLLSLHLQWGAKEAMYKAYGKKKIRFKEHVSVRPTLLEGNTGRTIGTVHTSEHISSYDILWWLLEDEYMLVYASLLL